MAPLSTARLLAALIAILMFAALVVAAEPGEAAAPDRESCEGYPEPRVFLEAQDWWQPTLSGTEDFGHVHAGACFPRTHLPDGRVNDVTGKLHLDVKVQMHENPGELRFVRLHLTDASSNKHVLRVDINQDCVEGGPRWSAATAGCVWWVPIEVDTTQASYDGFQEVRLAASVRNSNSDDMFSTTGWQVHLKNGKSVRHYRSNSDGSPREFIEGRGWYEGADYTNARLEDRLPYVVSGIWEPNVRMLAGSGGVDVQHSFASIDGNFHHGNPGLIILDQAGSFRGKLRIDTTRLSDGPHRLLLRADAPCDGSAGNDCGTRSDGSSLNVSTNSGALAMTFFVDNGNSEPEPTEPEPTEPEPTEPEPTEPEIALEVSSEKVKGQNIATVQWSGATGESVELLIEGRAITTPNNGEYVHWTGTRGNPIISYQVCDVGGCSLLVDVENW